MQVGLTFTLAIQWTDTRHFMHIVLKVMEINQLEICNSHFTRGAADREIISVGESCDVIYKL